MSAVHYTITISLTTRGMLLACLLKSRAKFMEYRNSINKKQAQFFIRVFSFSFCNFKILVYSVGGVTYKDYLFHELHFPPVKPIFIIIMNLVPDVIINAWLCECHCWAWIFYGVVATLCFLLYVQVCTFWYHNSFSCIILKRQRQDLVCRIYALPFLKFKSISQAILKYRHMYMYVRVCVDL